MASYCVLANRRQQYSIILNRGKMDKVFLYASKTLKAKVTNTEEKMKKFVFLLGKN